MNPGQTRATTGRTQVAHGVPPRKPRAYAPRVELPAELGSSYAAAPQALAARAVGRGARGTWVRGGLEGAPPYGVIGALLAAGGASLAYPGVTMLQQVPDTFADTIGPAFLAGGGAAVTTAGLMLLGRQLVHAVRYQRFVAREAHLIRPYSAAPLHAASVREKAPMLHRLWPGAVSASHVQQGDIGDCYLLAWMHGLKRLWCHEALFSLLFDATPDGYWMNFLGAGHSVLVPTTEIAAHEMWRTNAQGRLTRMARTAGDDGDRAIEMAYGRLRRLKGIARYTEARPDAEAHQHLSGGWAEEVAAAVFGQHYSSHYVVHNGGEPFSEDESVYADAKKLLLHFADALTERDPRVIATASTPTQLLPGASRLAVPLHPQHAYTLRMVDPHNFHVYLSNPHATDALLKLSIDQLLYHFAAIDFTVPRWSALGPLLDPAVSRPATPNIDWDLYDAAWTCIAEDDSMELPPLVAEQRLLIRLGRTLIIEVAPDRAGNIRIAYHCADRSRHDLGTLLLHDALMLGRTKIPNAPEDVFPDHARVRWCDDGILRITNANRGAVSWSVRGE